MKEITRYVRRGLKLKWKKQRIEETLYHLDFTDKDIANATKKLRE